MRASSVHYIAILTIVVLGLPAGIYANNLRLVNELSGSPADALTNGQEYAIEHFADGWAGFDGYFDYDLDRCMTPAALDVEDEHYLEYLRVNFAIWYHGPCVLIWRTSNGREARFVWETTHGEWFVVGYNLEKRRLIDEDMERIAASRTLSDTLSKWRPSYPVQQPRRLRYDGN